MNSFIVLLLHLEYQFRGSVIWHILIASRCRDALRKIRFKSGEDKIKFKNYDRQVLHPFVIYADFESTLQNIHTCRSNPDESYTNQIQKHSPNSFCVYTKCEADKHSNLKIYTGENCTEKFVEYLIYEAHRI